MIDSLKYEAISCHLMFQIVDPKVNPESYRLELVLGDDENSAKSLNLGDLKKRFPKHSISSTIPCQVKEGEKTSTQGPVWSGALLSDVLRELGTFYNVTAKN